MCLNEYNREFKVRTEIMNINSNETSCQSRVEYCNIKVMLT